jgi:energy-converting hydrogenase Eha subunit E
MTKARQAIDRHGISGRYCILADPVLLNISQSALSSAIYTGSLEFVFLNDSLALFGFEITVSVESSLSVRAVIRVEQPSEFVKPLIYSQKHN